jgi:hypothetical protein
MKRLHTAGKLHVTLLKFSDRVPGGLRNFSIRKKKISEIWQNCQKYFTGDFSPEEISIETSRELLK